MNATEAQVRGTSGEAVAEVLSKVPAVTLAFWMIKVLATTLGETFWAAFILTRPLGATVGDFLDKPVAKGGLEWSRPLASAVLAIVIIGLILLIPQRPGSHPGGEIA